MAYELHGLLAGNVSIVTGENIKPSYGGDNESFLRKVITPIYRVIDQVYSSEHVHDVLKIYARDFKNYIASSNTTGGQEEQKRKSSPHSLVQL